MLALVFILLLLPRLWIVFNSSYTFYSDDAIYISLARFLREGNWQGFFHPTWPPLYPALSAFLSFFFKDWETSARLVAVLSGTAIIIPVFLLLKKTVSSVCAISFTIAISLFTPLLLSSLMALSDSLAVLLITSGIVSVFLAFFDSQKSPNYRLLFLSSFLFGLVYLTRTEGTMFFFLTLLYITVYFFIKRQIKQLIKVVLFFITIFFLTISPYVISSRVQIGEWSLSPKFSAQIQQGHAFALNSRGATWAQEVTSIKSPDYQSSYFKNGADFIINRLYYFLRQYSPKQAKWQETYLTVFPLWAVPVIFIGLLTLLKKKYRWSLLYITFIMLTAIPITIFSTPVQDIRYLVWTIPFFLYLFYLGVGLLVTTLPFSLVKKTLITAVISLGLVLLFPGTSVDNLTNPQKVAVGFSKIYDKKELKIVGEWIAANFSGSNPKVMLRHEGVEFYAKGETVYMPQISFEELLDYAKKYQVDYIVAWDKELANDEQLSFLLNGQITHPGLQNVYSPSIPNTNIIVYSKSKKPRL